MLPTRTLRRASRSSPLRLVRDFRLHYCVFFVQIPLIAASELELDEEGTRISLTIVDTPGFGDQIDNEARLAPPKHPSPISRRMHAKPSIIAFQKSLATSSDNTMIFWPKSLVSSVTLASGTTVSTPCFTLSPLPATGKLLSCVIPVTCPLTRRCHQTPRARYRIDEAPCAPCQRYSRHWPSRYSDPSGACRVEEAGHGGH